MADLMIGNINATKLLRDNYKQLGNGIVALVQIPTEKHLELNAEALKILLNELNYKCVYIALGKPADELDKLYKSKGVDTSRLFFVDAISKMYGIAQKPTKKVVYTSGPLDIDSIAVSVRELLPSLGSEKKCVFLDSITTVLLYNSLPRTIRFSQFLTESLKKAGVDGVMVSVAKGATTEKLVAELSKLCDKVIEIA